VKGRVVSGFADVDVIRSPILGHSQPIWTKLGSRWRATQRVRSDFLHGYRRLWDTWAGQYLVGGTLVPPHRRLASRSKAFCCHSYCFVGSGPRPTRRKKRMPLSVAERRLLGRWFARLCWAATSWVRTTRWIRNNLGGLTPVGKSAGTGAVDRAIGDGSWFQRYFWLAVQPDGSEETCSDRPALSHPPLHSRFVFGSDTRGTDRHIRLVMEADALRALIRRAMDLLPSART